MDPDTGKKPEIPAGLTNSSPTSDAVSPEATPLKQIRTFQGDVADALSRQQESLVSIQRAEHLKAGVSGPAGSASVGGSDKKGHFFLLLLGSAALFILGAAGVWFIYTKFSSGASVVPITATPTNRFLSTNSEINLTVGTTTREALINSISSSIGSVPFGQLKHIVLRKDAGEEKPLMPTNEFLQILESRAPGNLVRAFDPLFMIGALGTNALTGRASTFVIIKLTSFENAFAGMLLWEETVSADLGPLFATAQLLTTVPPEAVFTDVTDRNKDIRVLSLNAEPVLLYSFFDNNMLIITDNMETLRTIIDRLTREKLSR